MQYHTNAPAHCDLCAEAFGQVMYDARTTQGCWGNLCEGCFQSHGVGLGTGKGQKYVRAPSGDNRWMKVAG